MDRQRSRSPRRDPERARDRTSKKTSGFKWKQKPSAAEDDDRRRDRDRDRRRRRSSRSRSPRRDRSPRRERSPRRDRDRDRDRDNTAKKEEAAPAAPAAAADGEEMIIVHVNDRLGTKAAIPCFGSDNIGSFKVMVAARIGREPHEILLKRQGERPFKDHITLADYGISNGVQIDLEVDTGD